MHSDSVQILLQKNMRVKIATKRAGHKSKRQKVTKAPTPKDCRTSGFYCSGMYSQHATVL